MTNASRGSRWRPLGAAIALSLVIAACSSSTDGAVSSTTAAPPESSTATTSTTPANAPTPEAPALNPATVLAEALAAYAGGYEFSGTATVNEQEASIVSGRWIDGASQLQIRSGSGEVEYLITPEGQWARLPDGEWKELEGPPPTDNPLAALGTPTTLEVLSVAENTVRLRGVYSAAALGLTGDPIAVQLVITDGFLVEASYTVNVDGNSGTSVTTFSNPTDTTPITVPAP